MTVVIDGAQAPEKHEERFTDPVVQGFYSAVIRALEDAPDGASAAAAITGEFHQHHHAWVQSNAALHADIRRLSRDEAAKAAMLAHAGQHSARVIAEHARTVGQLHGHQTVESRLHELAHQLDETAPAIAEQIRDVLTGIEPVQVGPVRSVIVAYTPDPRWTVGWFRRSDRPEAAPLEPLPYAGWALVAHDAASPGQCVESAFLFGGSWYTKTELAERGMLLQRID